MCHSGYPSQVAIVVAPRWDRVQVDILFQRRGLVRQSGPFDGIQRLGQPAGHWRHRVGRVGRVSLLARNMPNLGLGQPRRWRRVASVGWALCIPSGIVEDGIGLIVIVVVVGVVRGWADARMASFGRGRDASAARRSVLSAVGSASEVGKPLCRWARLLGAELRAL